jgi:glycerol-3-phosphate cytidylyltransferase
MPVNRVYTGGTFDILHVGHLNLLAACRKIAGPAGKVIVGLNPDNFIRTYKGEYPVNSYAARKQMLLSIRDVDMVVENELGADSSVIVDQVAPQVIVIGSDWATKDYYAQMGFTQHWLDQRDILLCYVPYTPGISSSKLRRHIID